MRIPKKVKIGAWDFDVITQERIFFGGEECDGLCDSSNMKIYLSNERNKNEQNMAETFIHECLHGIEKAVNLELGEDAITRFATGIYAFIKDNGYIGRTTQRAKKRKKRS